jgi:hypothetical protein
MSHAWQINVEVRLTPERADQLLAALLRDPVDPDLALLRVALADAIEEFRATGDPRRARALVELC